MKAKCWQKKVLNKWRGWERGTAADNRYVTLSQETPPLLMILPLHLSSFSSSLLFPSPGRWQTLSWVKREPRLMMLIFIDTINIISLGDKRWKDTFESRQSRGIAPSLTVFKYSLKSRLSLRFSVFFRVPPSSDRLIVVYVLGKGRCFDPDVPHLGREMEIRPSVEISKRQTLAGLR